MKKTISGKKIIAITLCFIVLLGMVQNSSNVYADSFDLQNRGKGDYFGESKDFKIYANSAGRDGFYAGGNNSIVIYSKYNCGYQISNVKLEIVGGAQNYSGIKFSSGSMDTSLLDSHGVIWINNIYSPVFKIGGGSKDIQISNITVYSEKYDGQDYLEAELWPNEAYETIEFNNASTASSDNFILESSYYDATGWFSGFSIKTKENSGLRISKLEVEISDSPKYINAVSVNSGTILEDSASAAILNKFHVDDIHSTEFECSISNYLFSIKNVKVYYEENPDYTASIISSGNIWIVIVVGVVAIGAIVVIAKKKKK